MGYKGDRRLCMDPMFFNPTAGVTLRFYPERFYLERFYHERFYHERFLPMRDFTT